MHTLLCLPALVLIAALVGESSAEACETRDPKASIHGLLVKPVGEQSFPLNLAKAEVRIDLHSVDANAPADQVQTVDVHVMSPLQFTVRHPLDSLQMEVREGVTLAGGRLTLGPGLQPRLLPRISAPSGQIAAELPSMEIEFPKGLHLPCNILRAGDFRSAHAEPYRFYPERGSEVISGGTIKLYSQPNDVLPLEVKTRDAMRVITKGPEWLWVQARWSGKNSLQGWVKRSEHPPARQRFAMGAKGGIGMGTIGTCGRSHAPALSTFRIHAAAPIHSSPGGPRWAQTAQELRVQAFPLTRSDGWVQIADIEGIPSSPCGDHSRIWVHAEHIIWK